MKTTKTDYRVIKDYDQLDSMAKRLRRLAHAVPFDPTSVARTQVIGADSPDLAKHTQHVILGFDNKTYWLQMILSRDKIPMTEREMDHFFLAETRDRPIPEELAERLAEVFMPGNRLKPKNRLFPKHTRQFFKIA